ncbi:hypothetical protein [Candidatus Thiodiazotropha sp. CDECU1]|uniref:hypothetical protein n=1 Tax=Candidatus Thiodiazotropha sp. CDECU1 TaxID=3065865 RepID=UPI0029302065|nr:hypothetical protein [Candidatus Thiodiazotropha sp. CDECU1]
MITAFPSLTTGSQPLPLMQTLLESFSDKPTVSREPNNLGKYPGLNLIRYPDQTNNLLATLLPRHPGEGRDPEATGTDWIPACAGMTMRGCRIWTMSGSGQ